MDPADYRIVIDRLPQEEGGGFLATVPDLPGCMSDGDTREEAVRNVTGAIAEWIDHANGLGWAIPAPSRQVA